MFSPDIVESDAFLEMPATAHSLYFHLGMYADDDGFVSPRKIMRLLGSTEDDIKILTAKRFVLPFENGVIVIKHWKMNNLVRKDWYRPTQYIEQKSQLFVKENGAYTLDSEQGIPLVNEPLTNRQRRLGKVSIGNISANAEIVEEVLDSEESTRVPKEKADPNTQKTLTYWKKKCQENIGLVPSTGDPAMKAVIKRAHGHLTWPQMKEKIDEWFDSETLEDHEMVQITRCFSSVQIDKFKAANV